MKKDFVAPETSDYEELLPLLALLLLTTRNNLGEVPVPAGNDLTGWVDAVNNILLEAHTNATAYGRSLAGIVGEVTEADTLFAQTILAEQNRFLSNFIADIQQGRYTDAAGQLNEASISRRLELYASRIVGTANQAWVSAMPAETMYYWRLGGVEDHCDVCPTRAGFGPYSRNTLPGVPGDGSTPCLFNCACYLETFNGERGFSRPQTEEN